jgi:aminopeptidase N
VVLADVDVDLRASAGKDASLTVVETLVPLGRPMAAVRLDLDSRLYTTFGQNLAVRNERLRKVTDESGRSLPFVHDYDQALIQLAEPAAPERPIKLKFEIDGDFLVSPAGDSYWELGTRDWFPQPSLAGQLYTFHATVRVKKPFVPFAPGRTIRRVEEGDENLLETRVDKPICFAVILAGRYTIHEEVKGAVTIRVATYALDNPRAVKQLTNMTGNIIQYYEEFLGPFPFPEFNIIEINDVGWGQAPPGTMFITKEAFNPIMAAHTGEGGSRGVNARFAHEIAHQYWGTVVKMPTREEQWLTESFADYTAALFMKAYKNEAEYKAIVAEWRGLSRWADADEIPIPLANSVYGPSSFDLRYGLLYNKGPALLYALHKELGDEAFFTFLKSYQKSFAWKFGSTKMVAALLQYMTKKDYAPFFEKYYWGTEMPK